MTRSDLFSTLTLAALSSVAGPHYARLRIVHAPNSLMSRIPFTPDDAERYAIVTRIVGDRHLIDDVASAIDDAHPVPAPGTVDVRWNLAFTAAHGAAGHAVSLDRFGRRALVDGVPAQLAGEALVRLLARVIALSPR